MNILSLRSIDWPEIIDVRQNTNPANIEEKEIIIFLLRHYTLYTKLTLEKNWEQGKDNTNEVENLSRLLKRVEKEYQLGFKKSKAI